MEDTRFVDLTIKVGFPYLYCHQGDCEHLVIITDIRSELFLISVIQLLKLSLLMKGVIIYQHVSFEAI